jgi:hypothetical protein
MCYRPQNKSHAPQPNISRATRILVEADHHRIDRPQQTPYHSFYSLQYLRSPKLIPTGHSNQFKPIQTCSNLFKPN